MDTNLYAIDKHEVIQWGGKQHEAKYDDDTSMSSHSPYNRPERVCGHLNGRRVLQVAASATHAVARTKDSVYTWGIELTYAGYARFLPRVSQKVSLNSIEQQIVTMNLDLSDKFMIHEPSSRYVVFRNHFITKENVIFVACTNQANFAITESKKVYTWGKVNSEIE